MEKDRAIKRAIQKSKYRSLSGEWPICYVLKFSYNDYIVTTTKPTDYMKKFIYGVAIYGEFEKWNTLIK